MPTRTTRGLAIAISVVLAVVSTAVAQSGSPLLPSAKSLRLAMRNFLGSLSREDQGLAQDNSEEYRRFRWSHEGGEALEGLMYGGLRVPQRELFMQALGTVLGETGMARVDGILALEQHRAELRMSVPAEPTAGHSAPRDRDFRDPLAYRLAMFGAPSEFGEWSWRFQGRHLSMNFVVSRDRIVATTPMFLGAEPARVDLGNGNELRVLGEEEDLARALLMSFDERDRDWVIVSPSAPPDIQAGTRWVARRPAPAGVRYEAMSETQRQMLWDLIELYAARLAPRLRNFEFELIEDAGRAPIRFAWAGSPEPGDPHYYRVHGPTFVIEYATVGGDPDHVHTVWRDFERDFGGRAATPIDDQRQ